MENHQIAQLLNQTLSSDGNVVNLATDALDRLSMLPDFPFYLLSIATGGENEGQKVAAATYLKNFIRRNIDANDANQKLSKEFRDALVRVLLQTEPAILRVLNEAFRSIVAVEFVKSSAWPEIVPELRSVIQNSNMISNNGSSEWKTTNSLTVLQSLIRPFKYFLNPTLAKEPVPPQLELIAKEILVPLLAVFHHFVDNVLHVQDNVEAEIQNILLIISKCIYFAVRSHMPSALAPLLPSLCQDLIKFLNSSSFDDGMNCKDRDLYRLKTGKRSLLIFSALVTRHRKISDKLMPGMVECVTKIARHSTSISKLDSLSERIVSLAFDVISRVLETGLGWRLVSPHFSSLLNSAIFPALVRNEKDMAEWEEDPDEYIRKNLPSELEEISGWREDLFTARKSAINLLGVISMSKGPPVVNSSLSSKRKKGEKSKKTTRRSIGELLVLPFLSKFPVPSDANIKIVNEYYGVLMAYSSLLDFLKEQKPGYTATLLQTRLLPLYRAPLPEPHLIASANWVLGELASCLPEEMSADIYSALMEAFITPDRDISCYPVRVSAAGAIAQLVENDYMPLEWLPLLQVIVGRISDVEEETSISLQLLGTLVEAGNENIAPHIPHVVTLLVMTILKHIPLDSEPWPQMVERGFATLAVMAQCWRDSIPDENESNEFEEVWLPGQAIIMKAFSDILQQAWLKSAQPMESELGLLKLPSSSVDDSSRLLGFVLQGITDRSEIANLKVTELLLVWSDLIADWHAWEEMEDLSIFNCIKETVNLTRKFAIKNFIVRELPFPPAPPVPRRSIIEGIGGFVVEAFSQYVSVVWRASSCVHMLLHIPDYPLEGEGTKQSLAISFTIAAFTRFRETKNKPVSLWKPLLLAISSCYLCCPDIVEKRLENIQNEGFTVFASALAFISTSKFEHTWSTESQIKLAVIALAKVVEKLLTQQSRGSVVLHNCIVSLMEVSVRLKEVLQEEDEDEESENGDCGDEETEEEDDDDEDSEDNEQEETEEEFLERCAETAIALENGTILEGDEEDEDHDIELGCLEKFDLQSTVVWLIEKSHQVLLQGQAPSSELILHFLESFPECRLYFPQLQQ
ncbi:importin beta-like SAD2 homolog isoform X2 [Ipomoea triloba]|uniref:importin beta-like SAD2 homolog isoform X2 n=1 Tax=Ipomoea triloba TaxID=35885 RepID=UPI00125E5C5C|nr:importin beta-like SAD2 homolog isoform X2 [Ipomoea triloba]